MPRSSGGPLARVGEELQQRGPRPAADAPRGGAATARCWPGRTGTAGPARSCPGNASAGRSPRSRSRARSPGGRTTIRARLPGRHGSARRKEPGPPRSPRPGPGRTPAPSISSSAAHSHRGRDVEYVEHPAGWQDHVRLRPGQPPVLSPWPDRSSPLPARPATSDARRAPGSPSGRTSSHGRRPRRAAAGRGGCAPAQTGQPMAAYPAAATAIRSTALRRPRRRTVSTINSHSSPARMLSTDAARQFRAARQQPRSGCAPRLNGACRATVAFCCSMAGYARRRAASVAQ